MTWERDGTFFVHLSRIPVVFQIFSAEMLHDLAESGIGPSGIGRGALKGRDLCDQNRAAIAGGATIP